MSDSRPASSRMAFAGIVLLVLGFGLWAVYRFTAGNEPHSFTSGAVASTYVQVTAGKTYAIAVPDGVAAEARLGLDPAALRCTQSRSGSAGVPPLSLTPERGGTKATNQIATFIATLAGNIHIECRGLPPVYVDDAVDAEPDTSGLWLVLATIALAIGAPLTLSVLRRPSKLTRVDAPQ